MKQWLSIGLFACLLIPSAGAYLWLYYQKAHVRHQVKQQILHTLPEESLTLLIFTNDQARTQLHWEEEHEFEYQHHFYDIVRTKTHGDTTWYWCWDDQKETHIAQQLKQLVANATNQDTPGKETHKQLLHFLNTLYCTTPFVWKAQVFSSHHHCAFSYLNSYTSDPLPAPSPPPETAC